MKNNAIYLNNLKKKIIVIYNLLNLIEEELNGILS